MHCEQAQQLFDAYLNGELPSSLVTELGAHRLSCANCRRELALLEVTGHIITSSQDDETLSGGFTQRLLSCMDEPGLGVWRRWRRRLYVAGPLAAAAVVVLAFLGVFDRNDGQVAGRLEQNPAFVRILNGTNQPGDQSPSSSDSADFSQPPSNRVLGEWMNRTQAEFDAKRKSGKSLQSAFDMTILQLLDIIEQSKQATPNGQDQSSPVDSKKKTGVNRGVEDM